MTKKDYVAIAVIIREHKKKALPHELKVIQGIQNDLAWLFRQDNPNFRDSTFTAACEPERTTDD